jgi:hypothetical protein
MGLLEFGDGESEVLAQGFERGVTKEHLKL